MMLCPNTSHSFFSRKNTNQEGDFLVDDGTALPKLTPVVRGVDASTVGDPVFTGVTVTRDAIDLAGGIAAVDLDPVQTFMIRAVLTGDPTLADFASAGAGFLDMNAARFGPAFALSVPGRPPLRMFSRWASPRSVQVRKRGLRPKKRELFWRTPERSSGIRPLGMACAVRETR